MPAIDFPSAPAVNDEYSFEGRTWLWNGTGWEVKSYPAALQLGSASAPSLYFTGDPNTGLYSPGADQVAISTNGTGRMFVASDGRVGISTAAPNTTLHVNGGAQLGALNTTALPASSFDGGAFFSWNRSNGSAETNICNLFDNAGASFQFLQKTGASTANVLSQIASTNHIFYTSNTERMRLDSNGRLGVGTSSPSQLFHVAGIARIGANDANTAELEVGAGATGNREAIIDLVGDTTYTDFGMRLIRGGSGANTSSAVEHRGTGNLLLNAIDAGTLLFATSNTVRMRINSDGKIGVATNTPDALFTVNGVAAFGAGSASAPSVAATGDLNTGMYFPGANQLAFSTNGSSRLYIDSTGAVGIGTNSPQYTLDVSGSARIGASDTSIVGVELGQGATGDRIVYVDFVGDTTYSDFGFRIIRNGSANGATELTHRGTGDLAFKTVELAPITFATSNTEGMRLDSSGRLGLGTSSPNSIFSVSAGLKSVNNDYIFLETTDVSNKFQLKTSNIANTAWSIQSEEAGVAYRNLALNPSGGLVGIGTTSPVATLHVTSADNVVTTFIGGATNRLRIYGHITGFGGPYIESVTDAEDAYAPLGLNGSYVALHTGASERARIDSSGRLLVGTSTGLATKYDTSSFQPGFQSIALTGTGGFYRYSNNVDGSALIFSKSRSDTIGTHAAVVTQDTIGYLGFAGSDGTAFQTAAAIRVQVDGTPGTNDMPGRLEFSTTADGASSPTERLRITSAGVLQVADAGNITVGTTTGTKIGTATTQKLGFYNATPVVQPVAVADATDAASAITQLNALLAHMRTLGLIAT